MFKNEIRKILQFMGITQSEVLHLLCPNVSIVEFEVCQLCKQTNTKFAAGNYLFNVNNRYTKTRYEICSELTLKTTDVVLASLLLTLNIFYTLFQFFYFNSEQVNTWLATVVFISIYTEGVTQRCFPRKLFHEYLASLRENIYAKVWLQLY